MGGLAVHEDDALHLQRKLESFLQGRISGPPHSLNALNLELHATDIKNGKRDWAKVDYNTRLDVLHGALVTLGRYQVRWAKFPLAFFGAVVDAAKVSDRRERERLAYELVLNKFDAMLSRVNSAPARQRGLVIHDQRVVGGGKRVWTEERAIQEWTRDWRESAGRVGQLHHLADIPLFADSQASRLIQGADLVSYALWRYYGARDREYLDILLDRFDSDGVALHGLIHYSRDFATGTCDCPPCVNRLERGMDPRTP